MDLRFHGTFGAAVIPPPKRARAISELRRMHAGDEFTLADAMSIAGLLEHLTPFASELRSSLYHFYYPHKAFHKPGMHHRPQLPANARNAKSGAQMGGTADVAARHCVCSGARSRA